MVYYPNMSMDICTYTDTVEMDAYGNPVKGYVYRETVPVDFQPSSRNEAGKMLCARRDTFEKSELALDNAVEGVKALLADVQANLLESARKRRDSRIVYADDMQGILAGVDAGNFVKAGWCGCRACEDKIKEETGATARVFAEGESAETCAVCGKKAEHVIIYARAY